jgi:hypothetical protein
MRSALAASAVLAVLAASAALADPPPKTADGYLKLGFDRLSNFTFVVPAYDPVATPNEPPPTGADQIPAEVKAWSGQKAMVTGYMLPTKLEKGKATEFLLMANTMACCFGSVPNMNQWVIVRMPKGTAVIQDIPISFYGTFKVGAIYDSGYMTGIYEMDAEKMADVKD